MNGVTDRWDRLAERVRTRRFELRLTQLQVAIASNTSESTVRSIETARRPAYHPSTLRAISEALGWTSDSIGRILDGGDPVEAGTESEPVTGDGELLAMIAELQDRLTIVEEELGIRRQLDQVEIDERAARNQARRAAKRTAAAAQPQ